MSLVDLGYATSSSTIVAPSPLKKSPVKKRQSLKGQTVEFRQKRKLRNLNIDQESVNVLTDCSLKCNTKSSKDDRQIIWQDFRTIVEYDQRYRYLAQLIEITIPKRSSVKPAARKLVRGRTIKYFLRPVTTTDGTNENLLCKKCFMQLFRLTPGKIRIIANKKQQNGQSADIKHTRGKKEPKNKITNNEKEEAALFLLAVPQHESHYGRADSSKRYLPEHHTKKSLFDDFKAAYPSNRVNFKTFRFIFRDLKLSIKTKACDTCKTCDALKIAVNTAQPESRDIAKAEQEAHWAKWRSAVKEKKSDMEKSLDDRSLKVVAYDLEQVLPTPFLTTSVAFYLRQLSTFNLTIFDMETKKSVNNIWSEAMSSRGSNEINSCLYKYALKLPKGIKHLVKYSDRCPGQNLNINSIIADMLIVEKSKSLETIDSKFLISGHTHMECDSAHATIEKFKKRYSKSIEVPDDWATMIEKASPKFEVQKLTSLDFYDFSENLKHKLVYRKTNTQNEPWKFEEIYWIRIKKEKPGSFFYKSSFEDTENFKEVNLLRKNTKQKVAALTAHLKYQRDNENPIKSEKKRDLLNLLPYIRPENHQFYENLKVLDD